MSFWDSVRDFLAPPKEEPSLFAMSLNTPYPSLHLYAILDDESEYLLGEVDEICLDRDFASTNWNSPLRGNFKLSFCDFDPIEALPSSIISLKVVSNVDGEPISACYIDNVVLTCKCWLATRDSSMKTLVSDFVAASTTGWRRL